MNKDLQIIIPTFNRASHLRQTLNYLTCCSFSTCQITILDNCSADDTHLVFEEAASSLPFLRYHRNLRNIGGDANIIRAYEMAELPYLWVLGDDDIIHIEQASQVLGLCADRKADLISLWEPPYKSKQPRGLYNIKHYLQNYRYLFFEQSLISATITKTDLITDFYIQAAYRQTNSFFAHLIFSNEALERNGFIYFLEKPAISRAGRVDDSYGSREGLNLVWYLRWCEACKIIKNEKIRINAMNDGFVSNYSFRYILSQILFFRLNGSPFNFHCFLRVLSLQPKITIAACLLISPIYILPKVILRPLNAFLGVLFRYEENSIYGELV